MAFGNLFQNGFMPTLQSNSDTLLQAGAGLLSGATPQQQVAGLAQGVGAVRSRNKTIELLRQTNPDLAAAVESGALSGGDAYKLFYQQKLESEKPKNHYLPAGGSIYDTDSKQWITPPANQQANQETYYGNPIPIQTANGIQYGQIGSKGSFKPIDIGEGNTFAPTVKPLDTGTGYQLTGPGGVNAGYVPKDVAGEANQKALGGAQGAAAAAILPAKQIADQISQQVADLKSDSSLPSILGPLDSRTPNILPGSVRAQAKLDQLKGGAFLSARQMLKGGGQITDYEGQRADKAIARMDQAQSPEDFKAALDEFNDAVQTGVQKLQMQAQGNFGVQAPAGVPGPAAPAAGKTSSGISFSVEP